MSRSSHRPGLILAARSLLALAAVAFSMGVAYGQATGLDEDWPRFLGPRGDGTSAATGIATRWPESGLRRVWDKAIGTGYSAPSALGNALVLHHRVGHEEVVECLDADTGKPRWRHGYPSDFVDPYGYNNGPRATPLLTTNACYTFGAEGVLLRLDLTNGHVVWQRKTAEEWTVPPAFFGVGSTPLLESNLLLVMVGGQPNAGVVALDAATGKTVWESVGQKSWQGARMVGWPGEPAVRWQEWEKQASYASLRAATIHGRRHLLCFMRQGLVSLDPSTGAVNFVFWFRSRVNESVNAMTPVVVDDKILISAAYYKVGAVLLQVRPDGNGVDEVWRSTVLEAHWSTPIYRDGSLYAFSGRNEPDARFRCIDFATGKLQWDRDEHWAPHSTTTPDVYGRGSCVWVDGKLIVLGEGGLLGLFQTDPHEARELARWQVPGLHYPCWAAPVIARRQLYLRSEDRLICLDLAP